MSSAAPQIMSRFAQLDTLLKEVWQCSSELHSIRHKSVTQCKENCDFFLKLLVFEHASGLKVLEQLQICAGSDAPQGSLAYFEQNVRTLHKVATKAKEPFKLCCNSGSQFWTTKTSPREELQTLSEQLCCTPLDPVKAAIQLLRPSKARARPHTCLLIAIVHCTPQRPAAAPALTTPTPMLWVITNNLLECHCPVQNNRNLIQKFQDCAWPEGQAVTAYAVSQNTGSVWTGHANGGIAFNPHYGKRESPAGDPVPIEQAFSNDAITAIALYESQEVCDVWVVDAACRLYVLKCEAPPGAPLDDTNGSLHLVGQQFLPAPATALLVHNRVVLLATAGPAPTLRLMPITPSGSTGQLRHMTESDAKQVPEPINHIAVLPEAGSNSLASFHAITASSQPTAHGLTVWRIKHHTLSIMARVRPPSASLDSMLPFPAVCGLHVSPTHRLLVTVHNDETPLRMWDLPSIQDHVRHPPAHLLQPPMASITFPKGKDEGGSIVASCSDPWRLIVARASGVVRAWDWEWLRSYMLVHSQLGLEASRQPQLTGLVSVFNSSMQLEAPPAAGSAPEGVEAAAEPAAGGGGAAGADAGPGAGDVAEAAEEGPGAGVGQGDAAAQEGPLVAGVVPLVASEELEKVEGRQTELGQGSFGKVELYKYSGCLVAVKKLQGQGERRQQVRELVRSQTRMDLRREVQHLSCVVYCPRFVRVVGYCLEPPMIVTEYYEHGSLDNHLREVRKAIQEHRLPKTSVVHWAVRLRIACGVAAGMVTAHKVHMIHGDLRSANIMLDSNNRPYIGDMGQSLLLGGSSKHHTTNPRWAAPELANPGQEPNEKTDVFSFGVILWELLTCDVPHRGERDHRVLLGLVEPLKAPAHEELPLYGSQYMEYFGLDAYEGLMVACLDKNPEERPEFGRISKDLTAIIEEPRLCRLNRMPQGFELAISNAIAAPRTPPASPPSSPPPPSPPIITLHPTPTPSNDLPPPTSSGAPLQPPAPSPFNNASYNPMPDIPLTSVSSEGSYACNDTQPSLAESMASLQSPLIGCAPAVAAGSSTSSTLHPPPNTPTTPSRPTPNPPAAPQAARPTPVSTPTDIPGPQAPRHHPPAGPRPDQPLPSSPVSPPTPPAAVIPLGFPSQSAQHQRSAATVSFDQLRKSKPEAFKPLKRGAQPPATLHAPGPSSNGLHAPHARTPGPSNGTHASTHLPHSAPMHSASGALNGTHASTSLSYSTTSNRSVPLHWKALVPPAHASMPERPPPHSSRPQSLSPPTTTTSPPPATPSSPPATPGPSLGLTRSLAGKDQLLSSTTTTTGNTNQALLSSTTTITGNGIDQALPSTSSTPLPRTLHPSPPQRTPRVVGLPRCGAQVMDRPNASATPNGNGAASRLPPTWSTPVGNGATAYPPPTHPTPNGNGAASHYLPSTCSTPVGNGVPTHLHPTPNGNGASSYGQASTWSTPVGNGATGYPSHTRPTPNGNGASSYSQSPHPPFFPPALNPMHGPSSTHRPAGQLARHYNPLAPGELPAAPVPAAFPGAAAPAPATTPLATIWDAAAAAINRSQQAAGGRPQHTRMPPSPFIAASST